MWAIVLFAAFENFLLPNPFLENSSDFPRTLEGAQRRFDFGVGRRFGLAGLDKQELLARWDKFNFRLGHFGRNPYHEFLLGLGAAYPVSKHLAFGVGVDGLLSQTEGYGSDGVYTISTGVETGYRKVSLLALVKNLNTPQTAAGDSISLVGDLLFEFQAKEDIEVFGDVQTQLPVKPMFATGVRIRPSRLGLLTMGVKTEPLSLVYGLCVRLPHLEVSYLGDLHRALGFSHRLGVGLIL